jgi:hypothetical protein
MVIVHAFLALLAGFATVVLLVMAMTILLARLAPNWTVGAPRRGYIFVTLSYSYLAAAAGGYVTAWIAAAHPLEHALVLGIVVLLLSAAATLLSPSRQPTSYQLVLVAIMPLGVVFGGLLRLRVLGIL